MGEEEPIGESEIQGNFSSTATAPSRVEPDSQGRHTLANAEARRADKAKLGVCARAGGEI
jgi:hypothetical protein